MYKTLILGFASVILVGCGQTEVAQVQRGSSESEAVASPYVAEIEPAGAVPVGDARQRTQDGDAVVLVGLIGGSTEPFVDGLAAFTIVDPKVPYCADEEGCPTPWDYCCQTDAVKENIATVKVVDASGDPVVADAKELLNVSELSTVVVAGKAERDDQGNLTVAANQVFVRPGK